MGNINENIAAEMGDYELLNSLRNSGEAAMVPIYFTEALNRMAKASESRQRVLEQALRGIAEKHKPQDLTELCGSPLWLCESCGQTGTTKAEIEHIADCAYKLAESALAQGEPARTPAQEEK